MKKSNTRITILIKVLLFVVSIITIIIGISSIFITARLDNTFFHQSENTEFLFSVGFIEITSAVILAVFIYFLSHILFKKIKPHILLMIGLALCFILFFGWIHTLKLYPEADQKMIYDMATNFNKNNDVIMYLFWGQYLFLFPYQFGLVLFVSRIFKIFGDNFLIIEYINALASLLNMYLLYKISNRLFSDKAAKTLVIFELFFAPYWMFFNVHFYGNILGLTFSLISIYAMILYIQKCRLKHLIISSIFIAISIIFKANYMIFLCGIFIFMLVCEMLNYKNYDFSKSFKTLDISNYMPIKKFYFQYKPIVAFLLFLCVFKITNITYDVIVKDYYHVKLTEGIPMITYVYMGMDEPEDKAPGWYSGVILDIFSKNGFDNKLATAETKKMIASRLKFFFLHPTDFISFYSRKLASTWLNPTFQTIWCSIPGNRYTQDKEYAHYLGYHEKLLSMLGGDYYKIEEMYFKALQIVIFSLSSYSIIYSIKKSSTSSKTGTMQNLLLLPLIFLGGFTFHIIWETKAIYVIQYYFLLLPLAANGLDSLILPPPKTTSSS